MKSLGFRYGLVGALAVMGFGVAAQATPVIDLLSVIDTGSLTDTTYPPITQTVVSTLTNLPTPPYGVPPLPAITPVTGGWSITVTPDFSVFQARADNVGGRNTQVMDGYLSFIIDFGTPVNLTATLTEDGRWNTTSASSRVEVVPTMIVSEADHTPTTESPFQNLQPVVYDHSGIWTLSDQVTGFTNSYTKYKITIDNYLLADSLVSTDYSEALIQKKDFTLILSTNGGGGVPEPSTLGVLATGCLALLARRRRV